MLSQRRRCPVTLQTSSNASDPQNTFRDRVRRSQEQVPHLYLTFVWGSCSSALIFRATVLRCKIASTIHVRALNCGTLGVLVIRSHLADSKLDLGWRITGRRLE